MTFRPRTDSSYAVDEPAIPDPTTTTSALWSPSSGGASATGVSIHSDRVRSSTAFMSDLLGCRIFFHRQPRRRLNVPGQRQRRNLNDRVGTRAALIVRGQNSLPRLRWLLLR